MRGYGRGNRRDASVEFLSAVGLCAPRKAPSGVEYSDEAKIVTMTRVSVPTRSPHWQPESLAEEIPPSTSSNPPQTA